MGKPKYKTLKQREREDALMVLLMSLGFIIAWLTLAGGAVAFLVWVVVKVLTATGVL